jgi:hypothetical protein
LRARRSAIKIESQSNKRVQLDTVSGARLSQPQQIEKARSVYPDSTAIFASCVLRLRQARSVSLGGRTDTVLLCTPNKPAIRRRGGLVKFETVEGAEGQRE